MRTFSTNVTNTLDDDFIEHFVLVELELSTNYYLTSFTSDLTVDGNNYVQGAIFSYDSPKKNSVLDREAYKISFVDPSDEFITEFKTGVVGKRVSIRAGFVSSTLGPLTDPSDLVYVYEGYIDSPKISNDFGSKVAHIECSSPMAKLDTVRPFFTTPYGMDQYSSSDTSFDRVNDGYELQLKWGKI